MTSIMPESHEAWLLNGIYPHLLVFSVVHHTRHLLPRLLSYSHEYMNKEVHISEDCFWQLGQ